MDIDIKFPFVHIINLGHIVNLFNCSTVVVLFLCSVALDSYNVVVVLLLASIDSFVAGLFLFRASIHWHSDDKEISSPQGGMTCSTPTEVDDSIIVTSSFLGTLKLLSPNLLSSLNNDDLSVLSRLDENRGRGSNLYIGREGYVLGSDP